MMMMMMNDDTRLGLHDGLGSAFNHVSQWIFILLHSFYSHGLLIKPAQSFISHGLLTLIIKS